MKSRVWSDEQLLEVSGSYWQTFTLHAGIKLEIFTLIGAYELKAEEIAGRLDCDVRGTTVLLNALAAMGLLAKEQDQYANTSAGKLFLVKDSPRYIGYMVMHHQHLVEAWSKLDQAVMSGKPVRKMAGRDEDEQESFIMGMFNLAMGLAPDLARRIDLGGRNRLLDLGGGPGTYAIHFCLANPGLRATVFDLPGTRPFATKTIQRFGMADRIDFLAGDYLKDEIKGTYDVAWLSHILHGQGPDECRMIIEKAVSAMDGGLLLIHDFMLHDTFDGPLFPALFSLNMLVNTESGRSYSENQIKEILSKAGLRNIRRLPFQGPSESGVISCEF